MRFDPKTEAALDAAAKACATRGAQLTPLRRTVLGLVQQSATPIGAYALLDQLKLDRGAAAPPTVYRALDFLLAQRLVHRLEKLNAFIACHVHECGADHEHPAQFLICSRCGGVTELEEPSISRAVDAAAARSGFRPTRATVEVEGTCARCTVA
jgi:Fur family zinc uptake transcriptional regulator